MDGVEVELVSELGGEAVTPVLVDVIEYLAGGKISILSSSFSSEVVSPETALG